MELSVRVLLERLRESFPLTPTHALSPYGKDAHAHMWEVALQAGREQVIDHIKDLTGASEPLPQDIDVLQPQDPGSRSADACARSRPGAPGHG